MTGHLIVLESVTREKYDKRRPKISEKIKKELFPLFHIKSILTDKMYVLSV